MNKPNSTTAAQQVKEDAQLDKLRQTINSIDCMCQIQLGQISSLVSIILRAMEAPDFWRNPVVIAQTLGLLQYTADDCANYVNGMAEEVGSNYADEPERKRTSHIWAAYREANGQEVANG